MIPKHAQVAPFLEADVQPWAAALASTLFVHSPPLMATLAAAAAEAPPQASTLGSEPQAEDAQAGSSADGVQDAWQRLDELAPFGGAVDAVLRAWRLPLLDQLRRTPEAWHPALLRSRVTAGELELSFAAAALSSVAMHALSDVHTVTLDVGEGIDIADVFDAEVIGRRVCSALASLRTLKVDGSINSAGMKQFAPALSSLTSLTCLDLSGSFLWPDVIQALAPALTCLSRLARLDLCRTELGIDGSAAAALAPVLGRLTSLECLDLSEIEFLRAGIGALAPALGRLSQLAHLNLSKGRIGVAGAAVLAPALARLSQLAFLSLNECHISPAGAAHLAPALACLTSLTGLVLSVCELQNSAVEALAPALGRLSQLAHLDLGNNLFCVGSAAALAPFLGRLTTLTSLNLTEFQEDVPAASACSGPPLTAGKSLPLRRPCA